MYSGGASASFRAHLEFWLVVLYLETTFTVEMQELFIRQRQRMRIAAKSTRIETYFLLLFVYFIIYTLRCIEKLHRNIILWLFSHILKKCIYFYFTRKVSCVKVQIKIKLSNRLSLTFDYPMTRIWCNRKISPSTLKQILLATYNFLCVSSSIRELCEIQYRFQTSPESSF